MSLEKGDGGSEALRLLLGFLVLIFGKGRIVVGVVEMWESRSDFQGRWETRETWFWFSWFSTARHFHKPLGAVQHGVFAVPKLANSFCLACCIRRAAAVSLSAWAMRPRAASVRPDLR